MYRLVFVFTTGWDAEEITKFLRRGEYTGRCAPHIKLHRCGDEAESATAGCAKTLIGLVTVDNAIKWTRAVPTW